MLLAPLLHSQLPTALLWPPHPLPLQHEQPRHHWQQLSPQQQQQQQQQPLVYSSLCSQLRFLLLEHPLPLPLQQEQPQHHQSLSSSCPRLPTALRWLRPPLQQCGLRQLLGRRPLAHQVARKVPKKRQIPSHLPCSHPAPHPRFHWLDGKLLGLCAENGQEK